MIQMQAPYKYIQGPGVFDDLGNHISCLGKKFFILSGRSIMEKKKGSIEKSFERAGLISHVERFSGEATREEYARVAKQIAEGGYDGIIGLGGGKVIDTAKAAANKADVHLVAAPSTASNDAPCSSIAVIYNDEGVIVDVEHYKHNPDLVIVDSEVIADAPVKTLVAGMGDALATFFEARVCYEHGYLNPLGSEVSNSAMALAKLCYELLLQYGATAKTCVENKIVSKPLEKTIEANIYLSGLGFESGGLSCAHSIQNALTKIEECQNSTMHGDRVAFGTICLLILEEHWEDLEDVMRFCKTVGLPLTFKEMNLTEDVEKKIESILPLAYPDGGSYRMPPGTTREKIYNAMLLADKLGQAY